MDLYKHNDETNFQFDLSNFYFAYQLIFQYNKSICIKKLTLKAACCDFKSQSHVPYLLYHPSPIAPSPKCVPITGPK